MKNHPQKGRGCGHMTYLNFPLTISPEWLKLETSNFVQWFFGWRFSIGIYKLSLEWAWSWSRDVFTFPEIRDNILETVQDRDMITMEDKSEIVYELSNGMIADVLELVWKSLLLPETFVIPITHK